MLIVCLDFHAFIILFLPGVFFPNFFYYMPSFSEMRLRYHIHQKNLSGIPR